MKSKNKTMYLIIILLALLIFSMVGTYYIFTADGNGKDKIYPDYEYREKDLSSAVKSSGNPFAKELTNGVDFTITSDSNDFYKTLNGYELRYVVGYDIEPGTYQLNASGDAKGLNYVLQFDLVIDDRNISFSGINPVYNIPLNQGDIIEIVYNEELDFAYEFIAQDEYVNYKLGLDGVFVYGLSNFEPQIDMTSLEDGYGIDYCDNEFRGFNTGICYMDGVDILTHQPGSYIITNHYVES